MSQYYYLLIEIALFFLLCAHMVSPFIAAFSINNNLFAIISFVFNIMFIFTSIINTWLMYFIEIPNKYMCVSLFSLIRNIITSILAIIATVISWLFYCENNLGYYFTNLILTIIMSIIAVCGTLYTYGYNHHKKNKDMVIINDQNHLTPHMFD